uniref:oligosaccharide flippase family protein n=1 Tax=Gemmiger sp. TaxID=2049027 RepID=UPI004025C6CF
MSKRKTYLQNAALLTGSGLVLRALGMGFRVVLAAYLGGEGMGLYQLILALYMVFVSFATSGINVASARLAAQSLARGSGMAETLRGLCFTALGFGTTAMVAQAVLAGPCARYLLHDIRAETALLILAPSLPFMAVSGACGGAFWLRGGCSPISQRSSLSSWCGWLLPWRGCGRWPSGARGTAAPPCCWATRSARAFPAASCWRLPPARRNLCLVQAPRCTPTPARNSTIFFGRSRAAACWPAPCRRPRAV